MGKQATPKGEATRQHILDAALSAFRDRGFASTTMRDIAKAAGMSLGAAYHYFDSKDAIVAAYYEWMQEEHERRVAALPMEDTVGARTALLIRNKLELLRSDRRILVALFATLADPEHPLSMFGRGTTELRDRSIEMFQEVFDGAGLPEHLERLAGQAAWMSHLALMLYFVHDDSKGQERTHLLADAIGEFFGFVVPLAVAPPFRTVFERAATLAEKLGVRGK